ncbi:serine/threonine-protein kinase VRK1-like [Euwallacea similis]|uniref:serine/threonine-protein kinase VRK1-like n=1 Tax=Euwallacea similis TaxID=1736056 RepID=UPI00344C526D
MHRQKSPDKENVKGPLRRGEVIVDNTACKWKLGKAIGIGGFGEIYDVTSLKSDKDKNKNGKYVVKIEKHSNGPLFVEVNCYLRLGREEMIDQWKAEKHLDFLGLPHFVASGSHVAKNEKYRFLIMPKYDRDLETILRVKKTFNLKTVLVIASRIIDTLEYIHAHGYVHSDIKASNIMLSQREGKVNTRPLRIRKTIERLGSTMLDRHKPVVRIRMSHNLRPVQNMTYVDDIPYLDEVMRNFEKKNSAVINKDTNLDVSEKDNIEGDQIYLLDYGLAIKYLLTNGIHREFTSDQRRAHAGTILFCSRDAHKGVASRRSDLESLAYNMIYWLTGTLPWIDDVNEPALVEKKKNKAFADVKKFLNTCFEDPPGFLEKLFLHLSKFNFQDVPKYHFFKQLFKKAIKQYGYKADLKLDFDNLEGWGRKQKKTGKSKSSKKENKYVHKGPSILLYSPLSRFSSNIIFKGPNLRKKINDDLVQRMNWSQILVKDPESIIKQATIRKFPESERNFNISLSDLQKLNPTPAMWEVFNKVSGRKEGTFFLGSRGDEIFSTEYLEGYTPEMMKIYKRVTEKKEKELKMAVQQNISEKCRRKRLNKSASPMWRAAKNLRTTAVSTSQYSLRRTRRSRPV